MNLEDSSVEKINPEILLPVSSGMKKLCQKNGTSFLVQVFGTGFWCVCHWRYSDLMMMTSTTDIDLTIIISSITVNTQTNV